MRELARRCSKTFICVQNPIAVGIEVDLVVDTVTVGVEGSTKRIRGQGLRLDETNIQFQIPVTAQLGRSS